MQKSISNLKFKLSILKLSILNVWEAFILKLIFENMKRSLLKLENSRKFTERSS